VTNTWSGAELLPLEVNGSYGAETPNAGAPFTAFVKKRISRHILVNFLLKNTILIN